MSLSFQYLMSISLIKLNWIKKLTTICLALVTCMLIFFLYESSEVRTLFALSLYLCSPSCHRFTQITELNETHVLIKWLLIDRRVRIAIGLTKKFFDIFPEHRMEKSKWTFWPTQYFSKYFLTLETYFHFSDFPPLAQGSTQRGRKSKESYTSWSQNQSSVQKISLPFDPSQQLYCIMLPASPCLEELAIGL